MVRAAYGRCFACNGFLFSGSVVALDRLVLPLVHYYRDWLLHGAVMAGAPALARIDAMVDGTVALTWRALWVLPVFVLAWGTSTIM